METEMPQRCIWCKRSDRPTSVEHIVPESVGCPPGFQLTAGEVCSPCNNRLGALDKALKSEFEPLSAMSGVRGKKNRPIEIVSRGNIATSTTAGGERIVAISSNNTPVDIQGIHLAAKSNNPMHLKNIEVTTRGSKFHLSGEFILGSTKKFPRALTKIAFESLAYYEGADSALDEDFDAVRQFVLHGGATRPVLVTSKFQETYTFLQPPLRTNEGVIARFQIANIGFVVDLSVNQNALSKILDQHAGTVGDGWVCVIPPGSADELLRRNR